MEEKPRWEKKIMRAFWRKREGERRGIELRSEASQFNQYLLFSFSVGGGVRQKTLNQITKRNREHAPSRGTGGVLPRY